MSVDANPNLLVQVINLARRPDRRESIAKDLKLAGISPLFLDAIDGLGQLGEATPGLLPSEIRVWQSHVKAIRNFLSTGSTHSLVLEDDATLGKSFDTSTLTKIRQLVNRHRIDILQIGYIEHLYSLYLPRGLLDAVLALKEGRLISDKSSGLTVVRDEFRAGAHAYLISRRAALSIAQYLPTPPLMAFDTFLEQLAKTSRHPEGLLIARVDRNLVHQRSRLSSKSTIDSDVI